LHGQTGVHAPGAERPETGEPLLPDQHRGVRALDLHPDGRHHLGREGWGRFWGWDTKEVWTFVIWVVYADYLHARTTKSWTGTRDAWLSIVGYLCVLFNFIIVNQYFNGPDSHSGLPK
jgi:hypothetical protein